MTYRLCIVSMLAIALTAIAASASAKLEVCNRTGRVLSYSHVIHDESCRRCTGSVCSNNPGPYRQIGWWVLQPSQCTTVYAGDARRTFYYFAYTQDGTIHFPSLGTREHLIATPYAAHDHCLTSALRVEDGSWLLAPHTAWTPGDKDARISLGASF